MKEKDIYQRLCLSYHIESHQKMVVMINVNCGSDKNEASSNFSEKQYDSGSGSWLLPFYGKGLEDSKASFGTTDKTDS